MKDTWQQLDHSSSINAIEAFATELIALAQMHDYVPLQEWSEQLQAQAMAFETDALYKNLEKFKQFL